MASTVFKFVLSLCVICVLCEKSPFILDSKITGTGVKEKIPPSGSSHNTPIKRNTPQHPILVCPGKEVRIPFFALPCGEHQDCSIVGPKMVCCSYRCIKGVLPTTAQQVQEITTNSLTNAVVAPSSTLPLPTSTVSTTTLSTTVTMTTTPTTTTTTTTAAPKPTHLQAIISSTEVTLSLQTQENIPHKLLLVCPERVWIAFFSLPCGSNQECSSVGPNMICCSYRCVEGILQYPPKIVVKSPVTEIKRNDLSNLVVASAPTTIPPSVKPADVVLRRNYALVCPEKEPRITLFSLSCETNKDCSIMGNKMICCLKRCIRGAITVETDQKQALSTTNAYMVKQTYEQNLTSAYNTNNLIATIPPTMKVSVVNIQKTPNTLACPSRVIRIPFFSIPCKTNQECSEIGSALVCCFSQCVGGVAPVQSNPKQTLSSATESKRKDDQILLSENRLTNSITTNSPTKTPSAITLNNLPQIPNLICPGKDVRIPFFSVPCKANEDCYRINVKMVCCSSRCIGGVDPPKPEIKHQPSWFGLVERVCPADPIAEILEIKECRSDADCTPRICCADKFRNGSAESKNYCRTAQPILDRLPVANRWTEPLRAVASYMQCTPPPPPVLDVFPKPCNNTLDCFPNLCCQEGGKKYCRPPKRSLLSLVAGVGQRLVPTDAAKRIIERFN